MKRKLLYLLSIAMLAACSAPRYSYNFDHYDYNAGKRKAASTEASAMKSTEATAPEALAASAELTASLETPQGTTKITEPSTLTDVQTSLGANYKQMSKTERKEFRKEVMHAAKSYSKAIRKGDHVAAEKAVQAMDHDLRMAVIFGAIGLGLSLFAGVNDIFWIAGTIAFIIGIVFLVKWIIRQ
ncbi:MAG TPA: hypothetical protein VFE57_09285 [Cyclobacteriaceae bacterium]|jgi:2-keto-4-pentenoate hydratase/2-oxohepta-3-ene-1,7-dioic acid hydratase in catechol pathway|nr:hypothetical protein [Cyclobacteriaceae bacterium]